MEEVENTYINEIKTLTNEYLNKIINDKQSELISKYNSLQLTNTNLESEISELKNLLKHAQDGLLPLESLIFEKDKIISNLQITINNLKQEQIDFNKVSHRIKIQDELEKLRDENTNLKTKLSEKKKSKSDLKTFQNCKSESESESEHIIKTNYIKKKIKKIEYYISVDSDKYVYIINPDNSVGKNVGQIVNKKFVEIK